MKSPSICEPDLFPTTDDAKSLGAFYTDAQVADFLVWWAVRSSQDAVLDPSFGGGVFLRASCKRLLHLGGQPADQVIGVEIDPAVHARITDKLVEEFSVKAPNLLLADFFSLDPAGACQVDAVVGNPPFIRYQRFGGEVRRLALARSAAQGVRLPELCSSWAPFLVHSAAMLRPGGRLAMVVPMEIAHARYAQPVLNYLLQAFGKATFLTFRKKLFPDLSEDTLLLLCEDKGGCSSQFLWRDLPHPGRLADIRDRGRLPLAATRRLDAGTVVGGAGRLIEYFIPRKARELYRELKGSFWTKRLGDLADIGIGYVTGANEFFHLDPQEVRRHGIPHRFLRPAVRRSRAFSGLRFTADDWRRAAENREASYLLYLSEDDSLPESVRQYLRQGEARGVPRAYKCRTRSPWFHVPHVYQPDAFLSYMSGMTPRLVTNTARVVASNSLHILRLYPPAPLNSDALAALWQTSLARLSVEIEGHPLGGGMLKVEPTEAEKVVLPWPQGVGEPWLTELAEQLDLSLRQQGSEVTQALADASILRQAMGLSQGDCDLLRAATDVLRNRRYSRSSSA
jgi:predicted RNA methylase